MRVLRLGLALLWGLAWANAGAQMPSAEEFQSAIATAQPQARALGLKLRTDALWLRAVQTQAPMVAALSAGECHIGYNGFSPRTDFSWMFPDLPADQRAAWIGGVIHHELAHCADQQDRRTGAEALASGREGRDSRRSREVLADLAFALHVTQQVPQGRALVARLAALRAARRNEDPGHDSSAALHCFLADSTAVPTKHSWPATLKAWQAQCPGDASRSETGSGPNSR